MDLLIIFFFIPGLTTLTPGFGKPHTALRLYGVNCTACVLPLEAIPNC